MRKEPFLDNACYQSVFGNVSEIINVVKVSAARSVNAIMTAAHWLIENQVVEFEQECKKQAGYGEEKVKRLATDLSARYGRGFSVRNVWRMKTFCLAWPIPQTPSAGSLLSGIASISASNERFN